MRLLAAGLFEVPGGHRGKQSVVDRRREIVGAAYGSTRSGDHAAEQHFIQSPLHPGDVVLHQMIDDVWNCARVKGAIVAERRERGGDESLQGRCVIFHYPNLICEGSVVN